MKKKILILLFTAIAAGALFLGLTACGGHIHTFSEEWSFDSYYHWHDSTCEHGDEIDGKGEHIWSSGEIIVEATCNAAGVIKYTCTDCGKTKEESTEEYSEHSWNQGVISTSPTCITSGIITYTCTECNEIKKEMIDANAENHLYGNYENDEAYHWRTCRLCGSVFKEEHGFNGASLEGDVDDIFECLCGVQKTVGELFAYKVIFECGEGVSVLIYDTKNYENGVASDVAYSRDSDTGELIKNGDGQVNFEIVVGLGYKLTGVTATPSGNFKNLKYPDEVGRDNSYRLTKITGEVIISIETEMDFLNLPVMVINTNDYAPILDKENYVTCSVSVLNAEDEYCFESIGARIRLRGNSTFTYPKKAYRIKFDSKQPMFGWKKNKSWVLLAMYQDFSNIKDYAAFHMASNIGTENSAFVPNAKHVEVYLNGQYIGLYLLTDQVQENAGRTGVETDFSENDIEVPFLVEWDEYAPYEGVENIDWFKIVNEDSGVTSYYNIKYPEADQRFTQAQFDYIKNYIITVNTLCHDSGVSKERFEEYVDLHAFIDYYLVQEIMGQTEINWKSIYMSKSLDGKLVMGPIWDFDWAAGGPMSWYGGTELANPDDGWFSVTNWFAYMLKVGWFKEAVLNRLDEIESVLTQSIGELIAYKSYITKASERNAVLWDFDENDSILDFNEYYDWVMDYLTERITAISNLLHSEIYHINEDSMAFNS